MASQTLSRQTRQYSTRAMVLCTCLLWLLGNPGTVSLAQTGDSRAEGNRPTAVKPDYPPTLAGAKQAFKDKNYTASLKILARLEAEYAGNVEYDYLLGRAALETHNHDLAVSALVRALTVDPEFAAARFELARTYYSKGVAKLARGPFEQARYEFEIVEGMNPPAELREAINRYQANIDKYLEVRETEFNVFVEMSGGYDSNVSSSPERDYFAYYDPTNLNYRTFDLRDEHQDRKSFFGDLQAGVGIAWPLFSNNFEVFGNLLVGGRSYSSNHEFDHSWDQVQFGARHYGESDKKTLRFRFGQTYLEHSNQRYHDQGEVMLEWAIKHDERNAYTFWLLGGDSNYEAYNTHVFSVNYNRQGVETTHIQDGPRRPTTQLLLMTGRDNPQECEDATYCPDTYTRDVTGIRLAWSVDIFAQSRFYSSVFLEISEYDRDFFSQRRKDRRGELFLAINSRFGEAWYLRPEIHYIENHSSVDLYDHERWVASVTVGWGY